MTIKYNDRDITLKFSFRADMLFEDAVGHTFTAQNESEWLQYLFCTLVALTKDETSEKESRARTADRQQKKSQSKQKEIKCRAHYYFRLLCFEYKVCSVPYFLDEMLLSELSDILDNIQFADRSLWESQRISNFLNCQMNSKKKLNLTDIYRLPFDEDDADKEQLSKDDFEQMQKQSKALEDYINSQQPTETNKV